MAAKAKRKIYMIHVEQICAQDFQIKARSTSEAIRLAEQGYEDGELDPTLNEGELSHHIQVMDTEDVDDDAEED